MKTPMRSKYPVLDNKPIDQWKVTELKEELKRRKLMTKGLKDDLIKRLDEALRAEMGNAEGNDAQGEGHDDGGGSVAQGLEVKSVVPGDGNVTEHPVVAGEALGDVSVDESVVGYADESVAGIGEENVGNFCGANDAPMVGEFKDSVEESVLVSDPAAPGEGVETASEVPSPGLISDPAAPEVGIEIGTDNSSVLVGGNVSEGLSMENAEGGEWLLVDRTGKQNGDSRVQQHSDDIKPPNEDVKPDSSVPNSQVSEVSSSLGFPVKSNNSISTDSVSIIEKNDLKDNIIADNVKLESDLKPEMVHPSSSGLVSDGGESHPGDVDEPHENKVTVEETDNTLANMHMSQKNYSADLGSSEKLNLDRSSGDDSMEEDALESKQIDSNYNSEEVGEKTEQNDVTVSERESPFETMDTDMPVEKKDLSDEKLITVAASSDKRKLSDEETVAVKPAKRQHRWKTESNNASESQISIVSHPAKDVPQFPSLKRNFSRSDSIGVNDAPKEREVLPSAKPATNSLRIDNFLRPFTLKAVQELLGKSGTVTSFWMDHIKTHCYVTYSSVEEAVETRNAVYNLQWPPNGGRQLVADFVDAEEVKLRLEPPPPPPAQPVNSIPAKAPEAPTIPQISPRQRMRQRITEQPSLPPPPPMLNRVPVTAPLPPPPQIEKVEAPIVTLDDLFRKTKATPRIYYLPLSEEQVAARRKSAEQQ